MFNILGDITLVTYGGGEILAKVFNAVAMLVNGNNNGLIKPLIMLCATITAAFMLSKALFSGSMEHLLSKFLFPIVGLAAILMVPTTSVRIDDILIPSNSKKVDHVPLLLGQFSSLVSTISYKITVALESILHNVKSVKGVASDYENTGMIFGSEAAVDLTKFKITNGDLEHNLRQFSKQCVLYDVALGKYSIDDLKKSTDLWAFFSANTSEVRMITYCSSGTKDVKTGSNCTYKTCKEAITDMRGLLGKEVEYYEKGDMLKNLPFTFEALTQISKTQNELVGQQLMMQMLSEEFTGNNFAKIRADTYQKSYMNTMGSLTSSTIVGTRIAIEALIYASFVLIIPLTFLPGGFKFISSWAWLVVWIQTWPPFFAIINYIMLVTAHSKSEAFFGRTGIVAEKGLSFFTNVGIQNIQDQVFSMGGFLAASVPFITYTFLKGGLHSIGSLASSIMSPISGAASMAANEQISGNYSIGNTSMGNRSYQNEGSFQTNISPTLNTGVMTANDGNDTFKYTPDDIALTQGNTHTLMSFTSDSMNAKSMTEALSHSEAATTSNEASYNEAVSSHVRNAANLVDSLSKSENYNDNLSQGKTFDIQSSASDMMSMAETYGKSVGISTKDGLDTLIRAHGSVGLRILGNGGGIDGSVSKSSGDDSIDQKSAAQNIVNGEEFRESYQKVENFVKNQGSSYLTDEAQRTAYDYSQSCDKVRSSQEAYRTSLNTTNQLNDNKSWLEQVSQHIKFDQTHEFSNWLNSTERMSCAKFNSVTSKGSDAERIELINHFADFNKERHPSLFKDYGIKNYESPDVTYQNARKNMPKVDYNAERENVVDAHTNMNNSAGLQYGEVKSKREHISHNNSSLVNQVQIKQAVREVKIDSSLNKMKTEVAKEANKSVLRRAFVHKRDDFLDIPLRLDPYEKNTYSIKERPQWHEGYK